VGHPSSRRLARGVSLIEVMIAVLIFSMGLIGIAGLLITATRSNQAAFSRTQLTFLVSSMADRMRANPVGLWTGAYNATYPVTGTALACDVKKACVPADVATRDKIVWSTQLAAFVPGLGPSTIACDTTGASYDATAQAMLRPPYGGKCTMTVTWAERGYSGTSDSNIDTGKLRSFTWVFEP
jgi:type IV pilus assembly protein PilV